MLKSAAPKGAAPEIPLKRWPVRRLLRRAHCVGGALTGFLYRLVALSPCLTGLFPELASGLGGLRALLTVRFPNLRALLYDWIVMGGSGRRGHIRGGGLLRIRRA